MMAKFHRLALALSLLVDLSSANDVFAVTTESKCAEDLPFGPCPGPLDKNSSGYVCTDFRDVLHDAWIQEFYHNDALQFTIDWSFQSGIKTLAERFINAVAVGEEVRWTVNVAPGLNFSGITHEEHHGVWRFSSSANLSSSFVRLSGSGFSGDDGSWGAAFTDGVSEVDGNGYGQSLQGGWGHENKEFEDPYMCYIWYANGQVSVCDPEESLASVMSLVSLEGTCFHGDTLVTLEDGFSTKAMSELELGDVVMTYDDKGNLGFSPVTELPHKSGNTEMATFLKLTTEIGKAVRVTPGHLLPNCAGDVKKASELGVGDCLLTVDGKETLVEVSSSRDSGVYTAVTEHLFIVADGIVASPYSSENVPTRESTTSLFCGFLDSVASMTGIDVTRSFCGSKPYRKFKNGLRFSY